MAETQNRAVPINIRARASQRNLIDKGPKRNRTNPRRSEIEMALWVLAPMLWAVRPKRLPEPPAPEGSALFWGDLLMVGGATSAYLWEFVWRPLFLDVPLGTASLWYILIVPVAQWGILSLFGALRRGA